jgi:hypothetical protein
VVLAKSLGLLGRISLNNVTIQYLHLIPRLDYMLDELCVVVVFSKVDLHIGY